MSEYGWYAHRGSIDRLTKMEQTWRRWWVKRLARIASNEGEKTEEQAGP